MLRCSTFRGRRFPEFRWRGSASDNRATNHESPLHSAVGSVPSVELADVTGDDALAEGDEFVGGQAQLEKIATEPALRASDDRGPGLRHAEPVVTDRDAHELVPALWAPAAPEPGPQRSRFAEVCADGNSCTHHAKTHKKRDRRERERVLLLEIVGE